MNWRRLQFLFVLCCVGDLYILFYIERLHQLWFFVYMVTSVLFLAVFFALGIRMVISSVRIAVAEDGSKNVGAVLATLSLFIAVVILEYAVMYKNFGLVDGAKPVSDPFDFVYFSAVTWTTLGYGDIRPNPTSRPVAASEALFGYLFMGLYIATIHQLIVLQSRRSK